MSRRGVGIARLLWGVHAFVLLVPVLALVLLGIYQSHLVMQTEARLIAEAALVGEAWRDRLLEARGRPLTDAGSTRPPEVRDWAFQPVEPKLRAQHEVLPPATEPTRPAPRTDGPEWSAGQAIKPLLDRAKRVNLSAVRVTDAEGCIVASTGEQVGLCFDGGAPEVTNALKGRYAAVKRRRFSDEPPPPLTGISRRGSVRVYVALPVFEDGRVLGVVRINRTAISALEALYAHRHVLVAALLACLALTAAVSAFLVRAITRPVREITAAAQAIARGEERDLEPHGRAPAEVHALGAALDTMKRQLRERAEYVREFAANASHELKTPITAVRGAAELLRESWPEMDDAQRARFLANIDADAARMEQLVTRLLQLARIEHHDEAGAEEVPLESFLRHLADRYGERVRVTLGDLPETLRISPEHLESAVGNLLDNAARHGGDAPVELEARGVGGRLEVVVRDRGPGISERNRERVLERFFTTDRDAGGTGLGLAIVAAVARARGGSVDFETGDDGTTFTLVL